MIDLNGTSLKLSLLDYDFIPNGLVGLWNAFPQCLPLY